MWLFQWHDTLDEHEYDCELVVVEEEAAGAKYLVMRGEGVEAGAEVAGGGWSRGGGRLNMIQIVSGLLGGGGSG